MVVSIFKNRRINGCLHALRIAVSCCALSLLISCKVLVEEDVGSDILVNLYATCVAPAEVESFKIDFQSVALSSQFSPCEVVAVSPKVIEVVGGSGSIDRLLSKVILTGRSKVDKIRLRLGEHSVVKLINGVEVPLQIINDKVYELDVEASSDFIVNSEYSIVVVFNIEQSVRKLQSEWCMLQSSARAFIEENTCKVLGNVYPSIPIRVFTITSFGDTISTIADTKSNNFYMLRGLLPGIYDIMVEDEASKETHVLRKNINVSGNIIDLGFNQFPSSKN